ncbi:MAG: TonB-dependent receptor plug domain-containing protein [Castellaniella sp.]|uniref:TonB-dependent receptor plug domain-containing protein n=1 Tax=Castellaniella sp. TaxID=1955812 RepID=UPI003A8B2936
MLPPLPRRLATVCCLFPLAATAQTSTNAPSVPALQDIIVTPSRSPEPMTDAIGDVSVIDRDQLAAARGDSLAEIIGRAPGMQFTNSGGPQTQTSLFLRGANSTHTLVLIDGMRINGSTAGGVNFPAIDPAMVERVEILRGAASSLYGSDAIGGVVNIITKKGEQDRPLSTWSNVGYGTNETARSSLGLSGAAQGWDYSFSASAARSKGFDAQRPAYSNGIPNDMHAPDRDGYRSHAVSGTLGYRWAPGHHIGLSAYNGYTDGDFDASYFDPTTYSSRPLGNVYSLYRQQAYALTSTDRITDAWDSVLRFGWNKDATESRDPMATNLTASLRRTFSWQNNWQLLPQHRLSLVTERIEERIQSDTRYDRTDRNTNAVALIYKGRIDRLRTQAGIRNDHYTDYGNQATGSLGMDLDLTDNWQIGVAGSTGFHAPTFNDMYYPGSINPDLKPEKSRNIEAHVAYIGEQTRARLTLFQNKIRDLIVWDNAAFKSNNLDSATIRGITLSGEHDFGHTTLRASADFLDPRNDDPAPGINSQLIRRARQVFRASVEHRIQSLKLGAEYQYTGDRYDNVYNAATFKTEQTRLGGFALINLTAAYDFSKSLGVQVRWNNVLDKDYVLVDGYDTPGSNVFINLSWRM